MLSKESFVEIVRHARARLHSNLSNLFSADDRSALRCPSCGQRGLTPAQKVELAPLRTVSCGNCGVPLSVAWRGAAVVLSPMILALLVLLGTRASHFGLMLAAALALGGFASIYFMSTRVLLEQRGRADRS
jgi:hypothetical protein